jgi:streptogramin lyase
VAKDGGLYIADDKLNQILELRPDGTFRVVAGNGSAGFSGDGGPAIGAELQDPQGMAVGADGSLYFADSENDRVRAISPAGIITTVAGNGASPGATAPPPGSLALSAALGMTYAVAIGPQESLYIAASNEVLQLEGDELVPVATAANFLGTFTEAPQADECDPTGIAFDGSGDLYMTCSNFYRLLELEPNGKLVDRGPLRPHDAFAAIAAAPDGSVITVWQSTMLRVTPTQEQTIENFNELPHVDHFWPQGVVVSSDGSIYTDQDGASGIGPPAIVRLTPDKDVRVLWTSNAGRGAGG